MSYTSMQFVTIPNAGFKVLTLRLNKTYGAGIDTISLFQKISGAETRHKSQSRLANYVGSGKDLLPSKLPTLRAIIRQGIQFQDDKLVTEETAKVNYPGPEIALDLAKAVEAQYLEANHELRPPVICSLRSLQR